MRLRLTYVITMAICSLMLAIGVVVGNDTTASKITPEAALAKLKAGNARFVAKPSSDSKPTAERRAETAKAQHPFAVIVTCSDSRTPPELIFDQNLGDLFVIRTAGNLIDDHGLGSIEYAVSHLGTRLVVVLGHERCGAVKAALSTPNAPRHLDSLVRDIQPAVEAAKGQNGDRLTNTIKANTRLVADRINKEAELGKLKSEVRIVTGYYDLDTGAVEWPANTPAK